MRFTPIQCASSGLSRNCESIDTAKEMLGLVAMEVYIRLPIASLYGTFFMGIMLLGLEGELLQENTAPGTMGVDWAFMLASANHARMLLI
jgi:hypothetical protein